mgnify:FL=1
MALIKLNNKAVSNATAFGSISSLGSMVFIKKLTASGSGTLSFVDGASGVVLDDTYKEYFITFNNIHPATDGAFFKFNLSTDTGSNYNVTKTSTMFNTQHGEGGASGVLGYEAGYDLAQSTDDQPLVAGGGIGNGSDESLSGYLHLFNPSSTTFVKHFIGSTNMYNNYDYCMTQYLAGYGNTTSAIDAIIFRFNSGNIDAGDICLYGIA